MTTRGQGGHRLKQALARLARAFAPLPAPGLDQPRPESDWGAVIELRLTRVEQKINDQNRLLLLTLISIALELISRSPDAVKFIQNLFKP